MARMDCIRCGYCLPCPAGIHIPELLEVYNCIEDGKQAEAGHRYAQLEVKADACIRCSRCEKNCPQHIVISAIMFDLDETFA